MGRDHDGPPQVAVARELASHLRRCIRELPEQQAAVFTLFYFEQLSRKEIAQVLETTVGAVSTALSKGRRSLRSALSDICQETNHDPT
jgi:RNA polymerase sigma-70 factor (ECF subfamily)